MSFIHIVTHEVEVNYTSVMLAKAIATPRSRSWLNSSGWASKRRPNLFDWHGCCLSRLKGRSVSPSEKGQILGMISSCRLSDRICSLEALIMVPGFCCLKNLSNLSLGICLTGEKVCRKTRKNKHIHNQTHCLSSSGRTFL